MAHRDILLAGGGELRPVQGDRRVEVELAALDQEVGADRGRPFRARGHQYHAVFGPRPTALLVCHTAPEIHHLPAAVIRTAGSADLSVVLEIGRKSVLDPLETRGHFTVYLTHVHFLLQVPRNGRVSPRGLRAAAASSARQLSTGLDAIPRVG